MSKQKDPMYYNTWVHNNHNGDIEHFNSNTKAADYIADFVDSNAGASEDDFTVIYGYRLLVSIDTSVRLL